MELGDLVEIYYITDTEEKCVLTVGVIIEFGNDKTGENLVTILKSDGDLEDYSMNINQIKFDVLSTITNTKRLISVIDSLEK
jgi:hypothetical protein